MKKKMPDMLDSNEPCKQGQAHEAPSPSIYHEGGRDDASYIHTIVSPPKSRRFFWLIALIAFMGITIDFFERNYIISTVVKFFSTAPRQSRIPAYDKQSDSRTTTLNTLHTLPSITSPSELDHVSFCNSNRYYFIFPKTPLYLGAISVPGYYTGITFSAESCSSCQKLRELAPSWLKMYKNLVLVDIDLSHLMDSGTENNLDMLYALIGNRNLPLPAMLMVSPFGAYMNISAQDGTTQPVVGLENIISSMKRLNDRSEKEAIHISPNSFEQLSRISNDTRDYHYAYLNHCKL